MFCNNCGKEIDNNAVICVGCGVSVKGKRAKVDEDSNTFSVSKLLALIFSLLSCLFIALTYTFVILGLYLVVNWSYEAGVSVVSSVYLRVEGGAIIAGWLFSSFAISFGFASAIIALIKNHKEKFSSILPAVLSLVSFAFVIYAFFYFL